MYKERKHVEKKTQFSYKKTFHAIFKDEFNPVLGSIHALHLIENPYLMKAHEQYNN